jgi:hypothetical protein
MIDCQSKIISHTDKMATGFQKVIQSKAFVYNNIALFTGSAMVGAAYRVVEETDRNLWSAKSLPVFCYLIFSSPVWLPPYAIYKFNRPTVGTCPIPHKNKRVSYEANLGDVTLSRQLN